MCTLPVPNNTIIPIPHIQLLDGLQTGRLKSSSHTFQSSMQARASAFPEHSNMLAFPLSCRYIAEAQLYLKDFRARWPLSTWPSGAWFFACTHIQTCPPLTHPWPLSCYLALLSLPSSSMAPSPSLFLQLVSELSPNLSMCSVTLLYLKGKHWFGALIYQKQRNKKEHGRLVNDTNYSGIFSLGKIQPCPF